ncbi:hypothetical protein VTN96DRAFT_2113 [Rasamsonia emersonii]
MSPMNGTTNLQDLEKEISHLEARLNNARARFASSAHRDGKPVRMSNDPAHALLLLSDSALPLGSFAYSSGLESYLAHHKPLPASTTPIASFHRFLKLSIASVASTSLPYLLAAYRHPEKLQTLDNDLDASTPCVVAQRVSLAQGRALLGVWERAFRTTYASSVQAKGHFAPLWGVACLAMGLDLHQTAYLFMFNHAKAVLSAAVRASVMGPYQAQSVLTSRSLQEMLADRIEREWQTDVERAGQVVPTLNLWVGRHELLYSRIFNS